MLDRTPHVYEIYLEPALDQRSAIAGLSCMMTEVDKEG